MKKLLAAVLSAAICLTASALPTSAAADISEPSTISLKTEIYDNDYCGPNARWKLEGGTLTIYGNGNVTDWQKVNDTPWYERMSEIHNVVLEEGITSVGRACFINAKGLTSVYLPSTLTAINASAFEGSGLSGTVDIPANTATIGDKAFLGCGGISEIIIRNGNCRIVGQEAVSGKTLVSPSGGKVEAYAQEHGNGFRALGNEPVPTQPTTQSTTTTVTETTPQQTTTTTAKISVNRAVVTTQKPSAGQNVEIVVPQGYNEKGSRQLSDIQFDVAMDGLTVTDKKMVYNDPRTANGTYLLLFYVNIPEGTTGNYPYTVTVTKATDMNGIDVTSQLPWNKVKGSVYIPANAGTTASTTTTTTTTTSTTTTTTTTSSSTTSTITTQTPEKNADPRCVGTWELYKYTDNAGTEQNAGDGDFKMTLNADRSGNASTNLFGHDETSVEWYAEGDGITVIAEKSGESVHFSYDNGELKADIGNGRTGYCRKAHAVNGKMGDVNHDNHVDARDASEILSEYAASSTSGNAPFASDPTASALADVNGDGVIDGRDATDVCSYYAYLSVDGHSYIDIKEWYKLN